MLLVFLFIVTPPAQAEKPRAELKKIENDLKIQQSGQQQLAGEKAALEKKRDALHTALVKLTKEVQTHEAMVQKLEAEHKSTQTEIDQVHQTLDQQRQSLARIVMALQRLSRIPPQAMLARPAAPIDMARSAFVLQKIIPEISTQAAEIKAALAHLEDLYRIQTTQQTQLAAEHQQRLKKQQALEALLQERQTMLAKNQTEQDKAAAKIAELSGRANDLRELMDNLSKQAPPPPKPKSGLAHVIKKWFGGSDMGNLPVTGTIQTGFGEEIPGGGTSQGLRIASSYGAIVTAPDAGIVRFAGNFRQYRLLVIIQHENGDHSLLGGLQELYTQVGAHVTAEEPIGKLPDKPADAVKMEGDRSPAASLYYERRRNGKPIDPRQAGG